MTSPKVAKRELQAQRQQDAFSALQQAERPFDFNRITPYPEYAAIKTASEEALDLVTLAELDTLDKCDPQGLRHTRSSAH